MTLIVSPETEARLHLVAAQRGLAPEAALDSLLDEALDDGTHEAPPSAAGGRPIPVYDPAALVAVLDSFNEGDAEEQRQTLEYLQTAIDRDRPGQRRIFGEGVNPMPPLDEGA